MKQEDKILLVRDIMARLPYNPKFELNGIRGSIQHIMICPTYKGNDINNYIFDVDFFNDGNIIEIERFKPYLFPLSMLRSIIEKHEEEYNEILLSEIENLSSDEPSLESFRREQVFYCKYHIDYNNLIPKGLALDATGLNIYI